MAMVQSYLSMQENMSGSNSVSDKCTYRSKFQKQIFVWVVQKKHYNVPWPIRNTLTGNIINVRFVVNLWNSKCALKSTKKCTKNTQLATVWNAPSLLTPETSWWAISKVHTDNLAQRCDKCMKLLKDLTNHMLLHNSNKLNKWNIYSWSYAQRNVFRKHMIVHSRTHVRNEWEKTFGDSSSLKIHMKIHSSEQSIKCLKCEKKI